MTRLGLCLAIALAAILAGCATHPPRSGGSYKIGSPYRVGSTLYVPREQPNYNKVGLASWYGPGFHGHRTADGEIYNQRALTAAHPTLPMPVYVRVTNLGNSRSLVVRVNDRGPFHQGRIIDVSERAAELLDFKRQGTARVRVEYLGRADQQPETAIASRSTTGTEREYSVSAAAPTAEAAGGSANAAPAGSIPTMAPIPNPSPPPQPVQTPAPQLVLTASAQPAQENAPDPAQPVSMRGTLGSGQLYVQVGAFADASNAMVLYNRVLGIGKASISPTDIDGQKVYRVRLGPVADADEASRITADLKAHGHDGAKIVMQ